MDQFPEQIMMFRDELDFLSNFFVWPIVYDGREWRSSEHAYQAMKSLDPEVRERIANAKTPGKAKRLGKTVEDGGIITFRTDWKDVRVGIMHCILEAKFSHPELEKMLLDTGDRKLVEGNYWHDNFFGSCFCERCGYRGENKLGKLLMQIREDKRIFG